MKFLKNLEKKTVNFEDIGTDSDEKKFFFPSLIFLIFDVQLFSQNNFRDFSRFININFFRKFKKSITFVICLSQCPISSSNWPIRDLIDTLTPHNYAPYPSILNHPFTSFCTKNGHIQGSDTGND